MKKDAINPSHYKQGDIECIDAIESAVVNKSGAEAVQVGNIMKYLWRYEEKNGIEDVTKCRWYLERLIKILEKKQAIQKPEQKTTFGILEGTKEWSKL
jgi:hypothetical protein